ncbi:hypothetical protein SRHO_G00301450 [Serrasalmus rhombeus]
MSVPEFPYTAGLAHTSAQLAKVTVTCAVNRPPNPKTACLYPPHLRDAITCSTFVVKVMYFDPKKMIRTSVSGLEEASLAGLNPAECKKTACCFSEWTGRQRELEKKDRREGAK